MRAALGSAKIFEMIGGRQGDVRRGDADDRPIEIPEGLVGDDRGDLRAPTTEPRIFLDREQPTRLGDRAEDRLRVERHKRAHVDHFRVDAVLALQDLGGFERARDHQRERDDRAVAAGAQDLRGSKRVDNLAVRHLALERVERLVLVKDHRIGIAHRRRHQPDDVDGR